MSDHDDVRARWRHGLSQAVARAYEAAHGHPVPDQPMGTRWALSRRTAVVAALAVLAVAGLVWWPRADATTALAPVATVSPPSTNVVVHVVGAVEQAGVVELPHGSRVVDALEAAGGASPGADLTHVNLARAVHDGEQIHVPTHGEHSTGDGNVNLNRASAAELEALPGIGPALAGRIVEDRERHGPFATVEDLTRVSGVGPSIVESIATLASV